MQLKLHLRADSMPDENAVSDESYISWKAELLRKGIHLLSLLIPISYFVFNHVVVLAGLSVALAISGLFDILRFFGHERVRRFLGTRFGFLLRPREKKSFSGATTILLAGLLVYLLYDINIAAAAMVIVVIGDSAAALAGRLFGKLKFYNKSFEGTLGFIIATSLFVFLIPGLPIQIAFAGVLVGALAEIVPIPIDDNVMVPLMAGGFMQFLSLRPPLVL